MKIKLALIAATLFAAQANAAEWPDNAFYTGVGAGQSKLKGDAADFVNDTRPGASTDFKDTTGKVFFGKQFNRNFGLEANYAYLGKYTADKGIEHGTAQARSAGVDAVVTLPVTEKFGVLGRAGYAHTRVSESYNGFGRYNGHQSSNDPKFGLGLQYKFNDKLAVRGEVEHQRIKFDDVKNHVNSANVSLVYTFGARPAPTVVKTSYVQSVATPAPAYTAPAAEPTPAPAVEAPVVTKKKVRE